VVSKAKIAVVGTGWWATEAHIPGILGHPDAEIVALCDADAGRLARAGAHYGIERSYSDLATMLNSESLDGLVIATSNASHYELSLLAITAGLDVLIEKPMTEQALHGRELLEAAAHAGTQIVVGHTLHYTNLARRARDLVAAGQVGEIELVQSLFATGCISAMRQCETGEGRWVYPVHAPTGENFSSFGQGQNQVTHSAALMAFVVDDGPDCVHAFMSNRESTVDAVDVLTVRFRGGALGALTSTGLKSGDEADHHELRIFGSEGYLEMDMERAASLTLHRFDGHVEELREEDDAMHYPLRAPVQNFVGVVLGRESNLSPATIAHHSVEIVDAAYRSAALEAPVLVADLYGES